MKNKNKKVYYSLYQEDDTATLNIFGDITSFPWLDSDVSNVMLSKKLEDLGDVNTIDVYINSYGGEVSEGLAIYNALKRNKAKVRTHIDGFACSIASVIFMAGDERIMPSTSCLMVHNPWLSVCGNANDLRKQADDLDVIGECSINAYMERVNISENELKELLDNETWISPEKALEMGFATEIEETVEEENPSQSVKSKIIKMLLDTSKDKPKKDDSDEIEDPDKKNNNTDDNDKTNTDDDSDENKTNKDNDDSDKKTTNKDNDDSDETDDEPEEPNTDDEDDDDDEKDKKGKQNKKDDKDGKEKEKAIKIVESYFKHLEEEFIR